MKHKKNVHNSVVQDNILHEQKKKNFISSLTSLPKEKPGFVVAIILTIIILYLFISSFNPDITPYAKALQSRQFHEENVLLFNEYLTATDEQLALPAEEAIEDFYLLSIKDDLLWLQKKELEVFSSKPNSDVLIKEIAFSFFSQKIIQINQDFAYDIGEPDYERTINQAIDANIPPISILTEDEINETFSTPREIELFHATKNSLFEEYLANKYAILDGDEQIERKYVEAKKLVLLSYS
jgi:hypothetical protein